MLKGFCLTETKKAVKTLTSKPFCYNQLLKLEETFPQPFPAIYVERKCPTLNLKCCMMLLLLLYYTHRSTTIKEYVYLKPVNVFF